MKSQIIQLLGGYKVQTTGFAKSDDKDIISVTICKTFFGFREEITGRNKVFFDMYSHDGKYKINEGFAIIDGDWIKIGPNNRNSIIKAIQKHFAFAFTVGNFRKSLEK